MQGQLRLPMFLQTSLRLCIPNAHPNFISSGHACASLCNAAWECPPSQGRVTDAREKESPPAILRLEGRGPASYPGLGVQDHVTRRNLGRTRTSRLEPPQIGPGLELNCTVSRKKSPKASGRPRNLTAPVARRWLWVPLVQPNPSRPLPLRFRAVPFVQSRLSHGYRPHDHGGGLIRKEERVMDPREPKRLTAPPL
ncbi:hypothetical protein CRG98_000736 [Punica granatum]|uniref:Uncharacterized protein n=1 Tax=Punica granatum TaxID=22663 RepID=A0A2I0LDW8_PUNGR|nr:hypothetical protein CRG98_000736 [Punica granatum]